MSCQSIYIFYQKFAIQNHQFIIQKVNNKIKALSLLNHTHHIVSIFHIQRYLNYPLMKKLPLFIITMTVQLILHVHCKDYYLLQLHRSFQYGQYYTTIYVGNPPQPQSVIIDNFQSLLLLNSQECITCRSSERNRPYRFNDSISSKHIECKDEVRPCNKFCKVMKSSEKCQIILTDSFGTYIVKIVSDEIRLSLGSNEQVVKPYYGSMWSENTERNYDENGILGLAITPDNIFNSFLQSVYMKQMGICMSQQTGYLLVGSIPNLQRQLYIPLRAANYNPYGIGQVQSIQFGDVGNLKQDHYLKDRGIFIMTRSPYTIFPTQPYTLIKNKIKKICENMKCKVEQLYQANHRKNMTCVVFEMNAVGAGLDLSFPPLGFKFEGYNIIWKASQYFVPGIPISNASMQQASSLFCLTFMNSSKIDRYAFGTNIIQNKHIIFDIRSGTILVRDNVDCSKLRLKETTKISPYFIFVCILVFLLGRQWVVKLIKRCRCWKGRVGSVEELNEETFQKDKVEMNEVTDNSVPYLK